MFSELRLIVFKSAATETARLTGGSLDYLINNAAIFGMAPLLEAICEFAARIPFIYEVRVSEMLIRHLRCSADDPETLTKDLQVSFDPNVIGVIKTINAFIPLLQKG